MNLSSIKETIEHFIQRDFFYSHFRASKGVDLPSLGKYATGIFYLDKNTHLEAQKDFTTLAESLGITVIHWRDVPVDHSAIGTVRLNWYFL